MALQFLHEGNIVDDVGNVITVWYLDMRDPDKRVSINTLVKAGRNEHAIDTLRTIRVSKPARFRSRGEGLIMDPTETLVSRSISKSEPVDEAELEEMRGFSEELKQCAAAIGARASITHSVPKETTHTRTVNLTLGKNGWIYSTSIEPDADEDEHRWRASMPTDYDHRQRIPRRREFARALGLMAAEHLGPRGKEITVDATFANERFESRHRNQLIVHGPVIYTANAFDLAAGAASEGERVLLPVFAKDIRYADQREYRFAIWAEDEPEEDYVDLRVSKAMFGSLQEWAGVAVSAVDSSPGETHPPSTASRALETRDQIRESPPDLGARPSMFRDGSIHFPHSPNPPALPVSPYTPGPDESDRPYSEAAATEAALTALSYKLDQVSGERRKMMAAAAWYAVPWIRTLCSRYEHPIKQIWISDEDILIVELRLPQEIAASAKIGFGPSGARLYEVDHAGGQIISPSSPGSDPFGPDSLLETLDQLRALEASGNE